MISPSKYSRYEKKTVFVCGSFMEVIIRKKPKISKAFKKAYYHVSIAAVPIMIQERDS